MYQQVEENCGTYSDPFENIIVFSPVKDNQDIVEMIDNEVKSKPVVKLGRGGKPKRFRSQFTSEQLFRLEFIFEKQKYLAGSAREKIAIELGLTQRQIKVWFQNRRMKWKLNNNGVLEKKKTVSPSPSRSLSSYGSSPSFSRSESQHIEQMMDQQIRNDLMEYVNFPYVPPVQMQRQSAIAYENYVVPVISMNPFMPVIQMCTENHQIVAPNATYVESNSTKDVMIINESYPYVQNPGNTQCYENFEYEIHGLNNKYLNRNLEEYKLPVSHSISNIMSSVKDDLNVKVELTDESSYQFNKSGFEEIFEEAPSFTGLLNNISNDWSLFPQLQVKSDDFL